MLVVVLLGVGGYFGWQWYWERIDPKGFSGVSLNLDLQKYDFDNLRKRGGVASEIEMLGEIKEVETRRKEKVNFTTREIRFKSDGKWVSGMINYRPERSMLSPVIIMIRGYAEKQGYYPGSGTWRVADELAKEGYATISLDFLGYGNSDAESTDVLEARFHKVIQVTDLIESVKALPWVDKSRIGIWAHSNGGQISLSVLEVTGEKYPTVLWAPMTNPFPQSLIDTADEGEEKDKAIAFVNSFLKYYDGRRYAFENYYDWIRAPILIQQGTKDVWCKVEWQVDLQDKLRKMGKSVDLVVYDGADHNMIPKWAEAADESVGWFKKMI